MPPPPHVVILAAGQGSRFAEVPIPKPLIPVCSMKMITYPTRLALSLGKKPDVVCLTDIAINVFDLGARVVPIDFVQTGPALSLLCMNGHIPDDEEVIVMACDDIFTDPDLLRNFTAACRLQKCAAAVVTATAPAPLVPDRWAYVATTDNGRIVGVAEKRLPAGMYHPRNLQISCGVFYFQSWELLRWAICNDVAKNRRTKHEVTIAPLLNNFENTLAYCIPLETFHTVGTPEQLEAYEKQTHTKVQ